ncbi:MAG TPA: sigma-54 dependent transcriptional regulator [Nitrospira sp.]|nr:sigma-54 dependent transcriptional regulator [Nitrospira sp.]
MRTLIIDDEHYVRLVLEQTLREEGCDVVVASDGKAGIAALQGETFDCVITDLRMPGIDGLAVLKWVTDHQPGIDVVMLTGHGDVKDAVEAMKQGAWDFLIKDTPFDGATVKAALAKLRTVRALRQENLAARRGGYTRDVIIEGTSLAWKTLRAQIAKAASSKSPVLIQGETGSGKEVVARLVHELSDRSQGPFLAVNCGAISRELLESELFGHEKGAFTGAVGAKIGLVTAADGGTLFLDELAEMPPPMQVSLLRFLDRGEYRPVGSTRTFHADVRVVAATNQNLEQLVSQARFREDLFYRINTLTLQVAPLRERKEDIPVLAEHILGGSRAAGLPARSLSPEAMTVLTSYAWPGNIRELRNILERAIMMSAGKGPISREELLAVLPKPSGGLQAGDLSHYSLDEIERLHVQRVLDANDGNKTQAAKILDIDYKTLLAKMKKYGRST